jgi:hypothetical protein
MSENALGKADSCSDGNGKEFSCPSCERSFSSELGLKQHHARTHGKSLAVNEMQCDNCGQDITVSDHELDGQEHHFCDRQCCGEWQKERHERECEICGQVYEIVPHQKEISSCCSKECRIEKTRRITGEDRYNFKTESYECQQCGDSVERSPSMIYDKSRVFCDSRCFDEYRRNGYEQYYGHNWNQQRRKALKRDQYRCQACGKTAADLYREPDVHHIKPIGKFKREYDEPKWWELANELKNLITFCPPCHREWEGIPLRPQ